MQSVSSWAPKVVRKCESKHWFSCGADGRAGGQWSMYGHVITKFSGMGRFTKLWSSTMKNYINKKLTKSLKRIKPKL